MSKSINISEILGSYTDLKNDIKIISDDIKYFEELLTCEDLSELEYYKPVYSGVKYVYMVYSEVENKVLKKEKIHNLNYEVIKQLKSKSKTKLIEIKNKIINIENAINYLNTENKYMVKLRFFDKYTYTQISKNFSVKFDYFLTEQSIKKRIKKSLIIIETKISKVLFLFQ